MAILLNLMCLLRYWPGWGEFHWKRKGLSEVGVLLHGRLDEKSYPNLQIYVQKCVQICFCYYMWNIDSSVSLLTGLMSWKYYLWARIIRDILLLLRSNGLGRSPCWMNLISESSQVSLCVKMGIIAEVSRKYLAWRFLTPYSLHLSGKWVRWCPYLANHSMIWTKIYSCEFTIFDYCLSSAYIHAEIAGALVLWVE